MGGEKWRGSVLQGREFTGQTWETEDRRGNTKLWRKMMNSVRTCRISDAYGRLEDEALEAQRKV